MAALGGARTHLEGENSTNIVLSPQVDVFPQGFLLETEGKKQRSTGVSFARSRKTAKKAAKHGNLTIEGPGKLVSESDRTKLTPNQRSQNSVQLLAEAAMPAANRSYTNSTKVELSWGGV